MAPFPFVGRSAELETLRSLIPRAEADAGRVALLGGEAGSGKSRLVRELSAQAAADGVPVLLVLEDGHWADTSTLLLLRYLARAATEARLLVLATFRDTDADVPQALSEALADLRRSDAAVRLHLAALSHEEIAEFVARAA